MSDQEEMVREVLARKRVEQLVSATVRDMRTFLDTAPNQATAIHWAVAFQASVEATMDMIRDDAEGHDAADLDDA